MSKVRPAQVEDMRAYRMRGFSASRIAAFMSLHPATVRRHLAGMPMPPDRKEAVRSMRSRLQREQARIDFLNRCLAEVRV